MSKGSNRRPEDVEAFDSGYNNIFKGGVKRGRFIFDEEKKSLFQLVNTRLLMWPLLLY